MACCNGLLVDNSTDVQTLCHAHVVEVFNQCNGLSYTQPLGGETGKDICLGIFSESDECLGVAYALLNEKAHVAAVAVNYHTFGVAEQVVETLAALLVQLNDFHVHIVRHGKRSSHGSLSSSHDNHVLHVGIVFLAHYLAYVRDIFLCGHKVGKVCIVQFVISSGDDGLTTTFDCHDMIGVVRPAKLLEGLVEYLTCLAQLHSEHHEGTVMKIPPLSNPTELQAVDNIGCGKHFGIDERIDAQLLEERLELRVEILIVVYSCHSFLGSNTVGDDTCVHVTALVGCDTHEEVGVLHSGRLKVLDARG